MLVSPNDGKTFKTLLYSDYTEKTIEDDLCTKYQLDAIDVKVIPVGEESFAGVVYASYKEGIDEDFVQDCIRYLEKKLSRYRLIINDVELINTFEVYTNTVY